MGVRISDCSFELRIQRRGKEAEELRRARKTNTITGTHETARTDVILAISCDFVDQHRSLLLLTLSDLIAMQNRP